MKTLKGKESPTMQTHKPKEKERVAKLQEQFINLQQDWDSYKNSNTKTKRRYSTSTSSNFTMVKNLDQLLDTSPRHLMSSLQQRLSPSEGELKVRTNDFVVEEIIRERRAAIESGKLKGRRLFEAEDSAVKSVSFEDTDGSEDDDDGSGKSKEIAVCYQGCSKTPSSSSSSSSSSMSDENVKREVKEEEEVKMVNVEEKIRVGGDGRRCMVIIMRLLAMASIVFAIFFVRGFAGYGSMNDVILVPT